MTNSSKLTSSANVILDVCICNQEIWDLVNHVVKQTWRNQVSKGIREKISNVLISYDQVYLENTPPRLDIRKREFNLSIYSARPKQSWVKSLNPVGRKNHFDISSRIKTIQLIQQFQHSSLNFTFSTWVGVIPVGHIDQKHSMNTAIPLMFINSPLCTNCINFINEDNWRWQIISYSEEFPH